MRVSENFSIGRHHQSGGIPPVEDGFWAIIRIANQVAIIRFKTNFGGSKIACVKARCGKTGSHKTDAADLPPTKQFFDWARPAATPMPALAKGKFVQRAVHPVEPGIESRRAVVQFEIVDVRGCHSIPAVEST